MRLFAALLVFLAAASATPAAPADSSTAAARAKPTARAAATPEPSDEDDEASPICPDLKACVVACDSKVAAACFEAGDIYDDGVEVDEDDVKARSFYEKACELRDADGCVEAASMYAGDPTGESEPDMARAIRLYLQGCEGGSPAGCADLAELYRDGSEVPKDKAKAITFFRKACGLGDASACNEAARLEGKKPAAVAPQKPKPKR
jgi:TPR repeat protein